MKRFLLGLVVGVILSFLFIYLGGGEALRFIGEKTQRAGEKIKVYERAIREKIDEIIHQ